jgi:hypothetical protein
MPSLVLFLFRFAPLLFRVMLPSQWRMRLSGFNSSSGENGDDRSDFP